MCGLRTGPVPDGSDDAKAFYAQGGEAAAAVAAEAEAAAGKTAQLRAAMTAAAAREDYAEAAALKQELAAVGPAGVVSASMADWSDLAGNGLVVDVVLASEVLYDPREAAPLARSAAALLAGGGSSDLQPFVVVTSNPNPEPRPNPARTLTLSLTPLLLLLLLLLPGTLLLADPAAGRIKAARAAITEALRDLGASVSEQPLEAPPAGDGWYSLRAGELALSE